MQANEIVIYLSSAETAELMELKRLINEDSLVHYSTSRVVAQAIKTALSSGANEL